MRDRLERWLHAVWYHEAKSGAVLRPLGVLYAWVIAIRRWMYARNLLSHYRPSVPVVIVGNITAGGVGKTPFVVWLVQELQSRGYQPGVITRGYGAKLLSSTRVTSTHSANEVGDESLMLARRLSAPVIAGPRRAESAAMLESLGTNLIICDDGLQHYALARDVEICLVDEQRQLGNGRLIPAGPLREPVTRLDHVDIVVRHRASNGPSTSISSVPAGSMILGHPRVRSLATGEEHELLSFRATPVHAVAGVGNPHRFFDSLTAAGLEVVAHPFSDHHRFESSELDFEPSYPILMTDKDAVKCEHFPQPNLYAVSVETLVAVDVEQSILGAIDALSSKSQR